MNIIEQAELCKTLVSKIVENVEIHENTRKKLDNKRHCFVSSGRSYDTGMINAGGYSKCQIQADIVMLRRELTNLSKMFEDYK